VIATPVFAHSSCRRGPTQPKSRQKIYIKSMDIVRCVFTCLERFCASDRSRVCAGVQLCTGTCYLSLVSLNIECKIMHHVCNLPGGRPDQRQAAVRNPATAVRSLKSRREPNKVCNLRLQMPEQVICLLLLK
jgi:hypothetical protein